MGTTETIRRHATALAAVEVASRSGWAVKDSDIPKPSKALLRPPYLRRPAIGGRMTGCSGPVAGGAFPLPATDCGGLSFCAISTPQCGHTRQTCSNRPPHRVQYGRPSIPRAATTPSGPRSRPQRKPCAAAFRPVPATPPATQQTNHINPTPRNQVSSCMTHLPSANALHPTAG